MEMNCRLFLNLGLVSDLQCQDNVAINFFKKVCGNCEALQTLFELTHLSYFPFRQFT